MGYKQFRDWVITQDIFGLPITVNYKGNDTFQTQLGSICTLLYYILIIFNTSTLLTAFFDNSRMGMNSQQTTYSPFKEPAFNMTMYNT